MSKAQIVTESIIESKIYLIRGQKLMLDVDLAIMYGVETRVLKQAVRRNADSFPPDFMIELSTEEVDDLSRSQSVILKQGTNTKFAPFAFTKYGVMMLSSVLKSPQARQVNIQIMRVYSKMKELLVMHKDILLKLEQLEKKTDKHDEQIQVIFSYLKKLIEQPKVKTDRIGFKKDW